MIHSKFVGALGVSLLALSLAACGGSTNTSTDNSTGGGASPAAGGGLAGTVIKAVASDATVGAFQPAAANVKVGDTVEWDFADASNSHTVTADDNSFDSGTQAQGATFKHTFTAAGTVKYHCSLHSGMIGTVTVSS